MVTKFRVDKQEFDRKLKQYLSTLGSDVRNHIYKKTARETVGGLNLILTLGSFWENNIYKFFNKRISYGLPVSGQLGKSYIIKKNGFNFTINMKKLKHSPEPNKPGRDRSKMNASGGATADYGKFLRNGRGPNSNPWISYLNKGGHKILFDRQIFKDEPNPPASNRPWISFKQVMNKKLENTANEYIRNGIIEWLHGKK